MEIKADLGKPPEIRKWWTRSSCRCRGRRSSSCSRRPGRSRGGWPAKRRRKKCPRSREASGTPREGKC